MMKYCSLSQWLSFLLLSASCCSIVVSGAHNQLLNVPRLGPVSRGILRRKAPDPPPATAAAAEPKSDLKTFFYTQTLDHFNYRPESYKTFRQRYVMNFKHWGGAKSSSPVLVYFGAESPLDGDLTGIGFLDDNAACFNALLVYIEHRYYGKSIPFGSTKEALRNASTLGYFNSAQAIADYAAVIMHVKKKLSAHSSPVLVIGGSYGGMLASWFRLKYPHVALGALASSAPILYFDGIAPQVGYYSIVTKDFKEASESCYLNIKRSWSEIDRIASKPNGLSILSKRFKTCTRLRSSFELKDYLDSLYAEAAQYNEPPTYPVSVICKGIDGAPRRVDRIGRIFRGLVAIAGERPCYDTNEFNYPSEAYLGWRWQKCSEMVLPIGHATNDTMFQPEPFNLNSFIKVCNRLYKVSPRPHWITTYYGGRDIKLILHRFASNIIFSNGLRDPYSSGGVLENISDSVVAVYTRRGSHCLDILPAKKSDPHWLVMQRKIEVEIIKGWLDKYYTDLSNNVVCMDNASTT